MRNIVLGTLNGPFPVQHNNRSKLISIQVFMSLSEHNDYFQHIITKIRSTVIDNTFKSGVLKFFGVPANRQVGQALHEEKPAFRVKAMSEIFKNK